ncbi:phage portal protein [Scatolibacter rhodanostii]|uniref:phage portal protein n=1 Tax=Scatolibacter rhodanostii TaxID=2014781 RepID=UPI001FA88602|nr:phage portal protein [Scatolibacter rhodanostii]
MAKIIKKGAAAAIPEQRFIELEISRWKRSPQRKAAIQGERYYRGQHDVLKRKRMAIGKGGELVELHNLPNNRVMDNQYAKMVNQKTNYLLGKPLTFDGKNETYTELLKNIFNRRFQRTFRNMGEDCFNGSIAWLYPYIEDDTLKISTFKSYEILPFWKNREHTEIDMAVRLYQVEVYEGINYRIAEKVEIYRDTGIEYYDLVNGSLVADSTKSNAQYLYTESKEGITSMNWGRIPLIAFKCNNSEIPLITKIKSLQDGINAILSDFQNNMQEDYRNTILIIKNFGGTDLSEFRHNLMVAGAVNVKSTQEAQGGVDALEINVNSENYKAILDIFKRALVSNAMGYDAADLRTSGSPNQMNIKSVLNDIDLDANSMETEFQAAFEDLLWFVNQFLAFTGQGDFLKEQVNVVFNRDTIISESEVITDIKNSVGILSDETLIAQHPYVTNVQEELERIQQQEQRNLEKATQSLNYPNAHTHGEDEDEES